jgi:CBS domain-containing protein
MILVRHLLPQARRRLVAVEEDAPLIEAARLLRAGTDIVAVRSASEVLVGVITKTDIVGRISQCQGSACRTAASSVMTRDVVACGPADDLHDVWSTMRSREFKNVTDPDFRPIGVLNARDALEALLEGVENEEALLRDYVMCMGYR